jgi:hypothetical protein
VTTTPQLCEFRRLLRVLDSPDKREVGSSSLPRPTDVTALPYATGFIQDPFGSAGFAFEDRCRCARIPEAGGRYLRVVLLPHDETVHNAFLGLRFKP